MAIVLTDPPEKDLAQANTVLVYSNADSNDEAMREIDRWARSNGFVRVKERWLTNVKKPGLGKCFKSICYRMLEEDVESAQEHLAEIEGRRNAMPMTTDSALLIKEN